MATWERVYKTTLIHYFIVTTATTTTMNTEPYILIDSSDDEDYVEVLGYPLEDPAEFYEPRQPDFDEEYGPLYPVPIPVLNIEPIVEQHENMDELLQELLEWDEFTPLRQYMGRILSARSKLPRSRRNVSKKDLFEIVDKNEVVFHQLERALNK